MPTVPTWHGTSLDNPITKVSLPLIAAADADFYPSGTACLIAPWLAITARHVVEDHFERYWGKKPNNTDEALHDTLTYVVPGDGRPSIPLFVQRTWYREPYDIAVLLLGPAAEMDPQHIWDVPILSLLPPFPGARTFSFGYPNSTISILNPDQYELRMDATTTTGSVIEVHHERRDAVRLPFPCFQTNARYDGGMSGAAVFNERGQVCGLVCSSLPPSADGEEHTSYVSTLWPLLLIEIDAPWDRYPRGTRYPLFEYAESKVIDAVDLDKFQIERLVDGYQLTCNYDRSAYEK